METSGLEIYRRVDTHEFNVHIFRFPDRVRMFDVEQCSRLEAIMIYSCSLSSQDDAEESLHSIVKSVEK